MIGTRTEPRPRTATPTTDERILIDAAPPPRRTNEVRVGAFVLLGIAAVVLALFLLTDPSLFRGRYTVFTRVDNAGGIRKGDPVQMRGVNIGRVSGFRIDRSGVRVRLELEGEYPVPADSRLELRSAGLLGGLLADVVPGTSAERLEGGDVIPGETEVGIEGLTDAAIELSSEADTVLGRVRELLAPRTVDAVGGSATELRALLTELSGLAAEQRRELAALSRTLRRSAANTEQATAGIARATSGPELERSVSRVDSLTGRLATSSARLERASESLETILARVDRGEGTLGKLTRDDSLYVNLNEAVRGVNELVADIRADPKKYINLSVF